MPANNPSNDDMKSISFQYSLERSGIVSLVKRMSLVLVLLLVRGAHADRLVNIPTGTKIHKRTVKLELMSKLGGGPNRRYYFGVPLGEVFDAQLVLDHDQRGRNDRLSVDASYNAFVPIPDLAPGVSIGIRDLMNQTHDGRAAYLAITNKYSQDGLYNMNTPAEVTWGLGTGGIRGGFFGVSLPFADQLRLIAEHDSFRLTAGFDVRPWRDLSIRWLFRQHETLLHVSLLLRF